MFKNGKKNCSKNGIVIKMLSKHNCLALLNRLNPKNIVEHSIIVSNVAYYIAKKMRDRGYDINPLLVHRAALLHDLDKYYSLKGLCKHGELSYKILVSKGYKRLAELVKAHLLLELLKRKFTLEELIVNYADKRASNKIVSLKERMEYGIKRYAKTKEEVRKFRKATSILFELEREIFKDFVSLPKSLENVNFLLNIP